MPNGFEFLTGIDGLASREFSTAKKRFYCDAPAAGGSFTPNRSPPVGSSTVPGPDAAKSVASKANCAGR
jgi:hypothetical protein